MISRNDTASPLTRRGALASLRRHLGVAILVAVLCLGGGQAQASAPQARWWPVDGMVTRGFDPPSERWGSGHRGIDVSGAVGGPVRAAAKGVVAWVGEIDGVGMVSVRHSDGLRTTYQPVVASVAEGEPVFGGESIGMLVGGHGDGSALHLGLRRGDDYLNPVPWLLHGAVALPRVRLLGEHVRLPAAVVGLQPSSPVGLAGASFGKLDGTGGWPASGPATSPFGWRTHPISGAAEFHDGIDIGAPCGSPVRSPWSGVVAETGADAGRGTYVIVNHDLGATDGTQSRGPSTSTYLHLTVAQAAVGQVVTAGQGIGLVGSTGWSTGCHLHFTVTIGGQAVDPLTVLGRR